MKLLAIDTSTWALALAVVEDGKLVSELNTYLNKNHSLRVMPGIEACLQQVDLQPQDLEGIAVGQGPGSYTGVRIGLTTAKSLAWSLNLPILGISSLQVLAQNGQRFPGSIIPMIDARREQVYAGIYSWDEQQQLANPSREDRLQLVAELLADLKKHQRPCLFIGEGVAKYQQLIKEEMADLAVFAREIEHIPRGAELGVVAWQLWEQKALLDAHQLVPQYLQLAEAEKNWLAKNEVQ